MSLMALDEDVEKLKARIELMRKCYFKGFGNLVYAVVDNCDNYLHQGREEDSKRLVLQELDFVEEHYKTIPFEQLDSNSDFAPLFVVRDLLPPFGQNARRFLDSPEEQALKDLHFRMNAIGSVGELYRENFRRRLGELRQIKGFEDFRVSLTDYAGRQYGM